MISPLSQALSKIRRAGSEGGLALLVDDKFHGSEHASSANVSYRGMVFQAFQTGHEAGSRAPPIIQQPAFVELQGLQTDVLEDEVLKNPIVMRGYRQPFDEEYFPALRYHATINNMEAMLVMLLSGGFVGFLPEHYARYWVERSELKPVECKSLVYRSRHQWATSISKSAPKAPAFAAFSKVFERFLEPDAR